MRWKTEGDDINIQAGTIGDMGVFQFPTKTLGGYVTVV
jgi:hypothetical protein